MPAPQADTAHKLVFETVMESLTKSAPGMSHVIRTGIAVAIAIKLRDRMVGGCIVTNGQQGITEKFRCWGDSGPEWTSDRDKALRFARRKDADDFAANDEDAWCIVPVGADG